MLILIDIRDKWASESKLLEIFFQFFSHLSQFLAKNDIFGPDDKVKSVQYHPRVKIYVSSDTFEGF